MLFSTVCLQFLIIILLIKAINLNKIHRMYIKLKYLTKLNYMTPVT